LNQPEPCGSRRRVEQLDFAQIDSAFRALLNHGAPHATGTIDQLNNATRLCPQDIAEMMRFASAQQLALPSKVVPKAEIVVRT
jgi:hypothetical protein